jgi:hypothetical protein
MTVQTREFALALEVRAEGRVLEGTVVPYGEEARIGPQVVEVWRPGAVAGTHPGDLPLLALPLVTVSLARWATPPGRTCTTVSRASTSERATTPGLPFPRVVARTGPGALFQPGLRADGVPPRCSGDHTPSTDTQRNASDAAAVTDPLWPCAAKAEQGRTTQEWRATDGSFAPPGGGATLWPSWSPLVWSAGPAATRFGEHGGAWAIRQVSVNRACVPKSHPAVGEPALARLRTGRDPSKAGMTPETSPEPPESWPGPDGEPPLEAKPPANRSSPLTQPV